MCVCVCACVCVWLRTCCGKFAYIGAGCVNLRKYRLIYQVGRVLADGPGDLVSIPGRVIPKSFKIVLGTPLLSTQQYKVHIKGKVEQTRERSSALPYTSV